MLCKLRGKMKGFTLIELMIVVAIIGIMAAIAIPNFLNYMCKSRQSEAKMGLGGIRTGEEAYYAEFNVYTTNQTAIGFKMKTGGRYGFNITIGETDPTAQTHTYTATAQGLPRNHTDVWILSGSLDAKGDLANATPGCY